jgi:hypothetical protein
LTPQPNHSTAPAVPESNGEIFTPNDASIVVNCQNIFVRVAKRLFASLPTTPESYPLRLGGLVVTRPPEAIEAIFAVDPEDVEVAVDGEDHDSEGQLDDNGNIPLALIRPYRAYDLDPCMLSDRQCVDRIVELFRTQPFGV